MKIKELSLWLLFLLVCFGAGYVKGYFPSDEWPSLWGDPIEVEILVQNESLLPDGAREDLQKKLKIQIKVSIVEDREAFTIRTITSPGYHLAIIPSHWIPPAALANQMSNLNPLATYIEKKIAADFVKHESDRIYSIPLYWTTTHLVKNSNDPIKTWNFIKDWDFIFDKMTRLNLDQKAIRPWPYWSPITKFDGAPAVFEISHVTESGLKYLPYEKDLRSLYIWSLATPRHSPSRKLTLKLVEAFLDTDLQETIVTGLPAATTLTELNNSHLQRYKKASYIREIDLSQFKQPQWLSLEQVTVLKNEFSN